RVEPGWYCLLSCSVAVRAWWKGWCLLLQRSEYRIQLKLRVLFQLVLLLSCRSKLTRVGFLRNRSHVPRQWYIQQLDHPISNRLWMSWFHWQPVIAVLNPGGFVLPAFCCR